MPEKLNVILIHADSLNRHFLPCYGNDWVKTPSLDAFARKALIFDQHFIGSAPCMPARRELWTGTQELWWRGWGPIEPWDQPIPYVLRQADAPITTHLVTDHYHFFEWGSHSYTYDYHGVDFIRGHEFDNWRSDPIEKVPDWARTMIERRGEGTDIYLRNVQDFETEADFFGPKVMQTAAEWLDRNHQQEQFFLHIDSFDVHEPFHIPEPYRSMYTDGNPADYNPWPLYGRVDEGETAISEEELAWVRAQYAGKLTMLDAWLGKLLERLDRYDLWERTCVILTTDHGHFLGEHGWIGKPAAPMYHHFAQIPLMIWHPRHAAEGRRTGAITQAVDLYATILEMLGQEAPNSPLIHSRSLLPVVEDERTRHREFAVYGYNNKRVGITTEDWTLLRYHDPDAAPALIYTHDVQHTDGFGFLQRGRRRQTWEGLEAGHFLPGVEMPVWRVPMPNDWARTQPDDRADRLYHTAQDAGQEQNLAQAQPEKVQEMEALLAGYLKEIGAPSEQFRRLRLEE